MKGDHELMLKMINCIRSDDTPLANIVNGSEEDRVAQVKSERDKSGGGSYEIINKKNKVSSYLGGGADYIVPTVWMDSTALCY